MWRILSPAGWLQVVAVLVHQTTHSPVFVLLALALGVLLWRRRDLVAGIVAIGDKLGKPTTDRFGYSLQVLILTLIAAAAWPLVVAVTGWQLRTSAEATDFSNAVGEALLAVAANFYFLRAFFLICMPRGLAAAHFRWTESSLGPLRSALNQLSWVFLPASALAIVAFLLDQFNAGWAVGRTSFGIMVASLAFALYRLLHPKSGMFAGYLGRPVDRIFRRLHRLWYPALVIAPPALGVLSILGYLYTAGILLKLLVETLWLVAGLVILAALAQRWLRVTRRRLAYEAAMVILFERPVRVGDIVTVGDTDRVVTKIRIRATTIRNWDRKELLVPNKEFVTGRLLNWSLSDQMTRIVIVVGAAYGSDVDKAHELMREAAEENEHVLDDPKQVVSFEGFGDNSLTLLLRAYIDNLDLRVPTITALHKAINQKFNEAGIVIAFPQRDLHLDTNGPLHVTIDGVAQAPSGEVT